VVRARDRKTLRNDWYGGHTNRDITDALQVKRGEPGSHMSSVRVLVVEDFEPFRRFVCSTVGGSSGLQVICEVSDGLEAVQKARELQPDLILLDIGLPNLNGIEAARQIRGLSPQSKILFVSQESSPDVIEEALSFGAMGYVIKAHAGSELQVAIEAVREGRQFVSSGVELGPSTVFARDEGAITQP
jgi:DNA-binding NarL/FixJ family response regulator